MSPAPETVLARLTRIVGEQNFSVNAAELAGYEVDGLRPGAVVRPASADEAAEVVLFCAAERLAVIPCGGRTMLGFGMPPARYDVALDLTRLNRVLAYDPGDLTLSVEAGIRLADLQNTLAEHKQFLPLMMPYYDQITIGGILATNSSGPQRHAYGTARDFLLGMEFITGEGVRTKSGTRVVKSVAGYDIHKLMTGALGTLGVITTANFRTFPQPPAQATFIATFPGANGALALRLSIVESPLSPHTLEITSPEMAALLDPRSEFFPAAGWSVVTAAAGKEAVVERHAADIERLAGQSRAVGFRRLTPEQKFVLWSRIREFPSLARAASPAATIVKMSVPPASFGAAIENARQVLEKQGVPAKMHVRAVGVIYLLLLPPGKDPAALETLARACNEIFRVAAEAGGHAVVEWCPTELKQRVNVWGPPREDVALMRKLKSAFDPQNILSPGRFFGGI